VSLTILPASAHKNSKISKAHNARLASPNPAREDDAMTPQPDTAQTILAAACILDAALSALDPSGRALRDTTTNLRDGLMLAEQVGIENVRAAEIVKQVIATLKGMNSQ